jgi:hypothetical protein
MRVCPNDMCVHFEVLLCSELCAFWQQSRHVCMLRLQFGSTDFHSGVPLLPLSSWCDPAPTNAPPLFSHFEAMKLDEPQFRTPGTNLEPSAMQRLAWEQEPNPKMCPVHAHPSMVVCLWVYMHHPCMVVYRWYWLTLALLLWLTFFIHSLAVTSKVQATTLSLICTCSYSLSVARRGLVYCL